MTAKSLASIIAILMSNAMHFRMRRYAGIPSLPQAVSLEITRRCVARCIMCNIWKDPRPEDDLSCAQWLSFLDDPLFRQLSELDITGGEPFLRNDLAALVKRVCKMQENRLPALASIAITTNGLLCDRVIHETEAMLASAKNHGVHLVIVCAVDASDSLHDRIRNHTNAWSRVSYTIESLAKMRSRHPNLVLGLKTTVLPFNVHKLDAIREYALARKMFTIISPCIITPGRYLNPDRAGDLAFSVEDIEKMIIFFRDQPHEWGFHADSIVSVFEGRRRRKICSAGYNYFFVRSNGEMMLCPLIDFSVGNIAHTQAARLYRSQSANAFRRRIGHYEQCKNCTEPGLERYSLAYEGFGLLLYLWRKGKLQFLKEFQHLGLDKLINR